MIEVIDFFKSTKVKLMTNILNNDTLKNIKEKIFISYDLNKHFITPNIMALGNGKKYLLNDEYIDTKQIIVYNLIDELKEYIFKNIDTFLNLNSNSNIISSLYTDLKKIYTDLTTFDLFLTIQYILIETINLSISIDDLKIWKKNTFNLQANLIKKYKIYNDNSDKIYEHLFINSKGEYSYSVLSSVIYYNISDKTLDLLKIIKEYPLDSNVPVMLLNNYPNPIIKIYKDFPKSQLTEWYFKNKNELVLKKIKGLNLKLKTSFNKYSNVTISKEKGKLTIRCNWSKEEKTNFDDIKLCIATLPLLIKKINNIFLNIDVKLSEPKISFLNVQFNTKKRILFSKIKLAIKDFKDIFSIDESVKKKEFIKLLYISDNITILIRYGTFTLNNIEYPSNSIDIIGVRTKNQINTIIFLLGQLLVKAYSYKNAVSFKNFQFVEINDEDIILEDKVKANIKALKEEGASISSTSCQKKRQPIISSGSPSSNSYALTFKGNRFICNNEPFIYPGFTNKNIVCCFKKDQREKEIYKRNITLVDKSKSKSKNDNKDKDKHDSQIIKSKVIVTDKLLDKNRIGILPSILYEIFDKSFYRLGVTQDRKNLLNVINSALKTSVKTDDILKFINDKHNHIKYIKEQLKNLNIIHYIENEYMDHEIIGDILSVLFNINIIVFNIDDNKISCKELLYLPYDNYIFIVKKGSNYELIVSKVSDTFLKKVFKNTDKITQTVINIYKRSCITKYTGFSKEPMTFLDLLNNKIVITSQVINSFNKVTYVLTKSSGLLPVIPTTPILNIKEININKAKLDAGIQMSLLLKSSIDYIQPIGQIVDSLDKTIGIVTKSSLIIPTLPSTKLNNTPVIYRTFIDNIDEVLYNQVPSLDKRYTYMLYVNFYVELYNRFKYTLSKILNLKNSSNVKNDISSALKSLKNNEKLHKFLKETINKLLLPEIVFIDKLKPEPIPSSRNKCSELTYDNCMSDLFCKVGGNKKCLLAVEKKIYNQFITKLAIEIVSNKNILSGNIKKEFITKDNFIKRKNEIVLITEKNIIDFFTT